MDFVLYTLQKLKKATVAYDYINAFFVKNSRKKSKSTEIVPKIKTSIIKAMIRFAETVITILLY